jgi:hypothetical protein
VDLVEVDMVEPEPREAGVDLVQQVVAAGAGVVRPLAHRPHALGGDHHLVARHAQGLQRAADELLALPGGVEIGGVDEVDPAVERLLTSAVEPAWSRSCWKNPLGLLPKVIAPRHSSDTTRPLIPNRLYRMCSSLAACV